MVNMSNERLEQTITNMLTWQAKATIQTARLLEQQRDQAQQLADLAEQVEQLQRPEEALAHASSAVDYWRERYHTEHKAHREIKAGYDIERSRRQARERDIKAMTAALDQATEAREAARQEIEQLTAALEKERDQRTEQTASEKTYKAALKEEIDIQAGVIDAAYDYLTRAADQLEQAAAGYINATAGDLAEEIRIFTDDLKVEE